MDEESLGSISLLYVRMRNGDPASARDLWDRYFPRLTNLANAVLSVRQLPLGAEDAVQEAFWKFLVRVEEGKYDDDLRRDDLWRILSKFTVQRARKQILKEKTQKRGGGRVRTESELASSSSRGFRLDAVFSDVPTADCDMIFQELLEQLGSELREIAVMRLAGYSNLQIRDFLGCSLRSVERRIQLIRSIWKEQAEE